ncbi:MAG: M24 family metallopeptidase [candidate division Zixibacteria bacterium]|nr:M24 family metallopeptidase [candidate division Zixibacteria bacterium]
MERFISVGIISLMEIVREKVKQACKLLDELNIDLWLIFVRETSVMADPTLSLVVGHHATWQSFFAYSRTGETVALVGDFDQENFIRSGCFTDVLTYTRSVRDDFRKFISRFDPETIAINYSTSNPSADGLTHGMYQLLRGYLEGLPYRERLISADELTGKLRSRKLPIEIKRLSRAATIANDCWTEVVPQIETGMTEIEIAALIDGLIKQKGAQPSFDTIVNAGDKTKPGHSLPTDARVQPGDLLHVDFGARYDDYCSDIQRLLYFCRKGETGPPSEMSEAFDLVGNIITETGRKCCPGVQGHEVDALARQMLTDHGFSEYQHALGHQLGRDVHDGGAIIGPKWERYGVTPTIELEAGNVLTLELEIILPGIGCVGLEEDMQVTENGAEFLCPRQLQLDIKP